MGPSIDYLTSFLQDHLWSCRSSVCVQRWRGKLSQRSSAMRHWSLRHAEQLPVPFHTLLLIPCIGAKPGYAWCQCCCAAVLCPQAGAGSGCYCTELPSTTALPSWRGICSGQCLQLQVFFKSFCQEHTQEIGYTKTACFPYGGGLTWQVGQHHIVIGSAPPFQWNGRD